MSNTIKESNITDSAVTTSKIADNAITADKIAPGAVVATDVGAEVITGQTELAEAANNADTLLIHDTSASSLKKITVSNLTAQAGDGLSKTNSTLAVDINGTTELSAGAATGDFVLIYDSSAGVLRKISQQNLLNFPTISSVSPTNLTSGDGTGNYTIVITGSGFTGATAKLLKSDNATEISFDSQTVDSDTQITGTIAKSSLSNADEPFGVKISAASGLNSQLNQQITLDAQPIWSTASGSLATVLDSGRASFSAITVAAADPESGGDVTYTLESGSLPAGLSGSSTSSGYVISGTPSAVGSNTTSTFTIRASDVNSNTQDREFSITVNAPSITSYTSSGTFSVPSGVTAVNVLVVAGGGSGGREGGGGGAGGLIYRPAFPVTPGGTVTVTVGCGGVGVPGGSAQNGNAGQDSIFGTLTAKGGGYGGTYNTSGGPGGSGGGVGRDTITPTHSGGSATQPTQPGDSGTYGFGFNGGGAGRGSPDSWLGAGGGGGAGAAGGPGPAANGPPDDSNPVYGYGGIGKAYTIADGTTSVYYAGGGGGSRQHPTCSAFAAGGQGGGGNGGVFWSNTPQRSATAGTANRGGGSGGHYTEAGSPGGKGIVIVAY